MEGAKCVKIYQVNGNLKTPEGAKHFQGGQEGLTPLVSLDYEPAIFIRYLWRCSKVDKYSLPECISGNAINEKFLTGEGDTPPLKPLILVTQDPSFSHTTEKSFWCHWSAPQVEEGKPDRHYRDLPIVTQKRMFCWYIITLLSFFTIHLPTSCSNHSSEQEGAALQSNNCIINVSNYHNIMFKIQG